MADDNLPPTSPDFPHAVATAANAPPAHAAGVTTAPADDADASPSDIAQGLLRSVLHAVLGGVIGLALGFLLNFICIFLFRWPNTTSTLILMLGGGLLLGVAFSGSLVRLLGLTPRVQPGARSVIVGGEEGRSEIQLVASWLLGALLVLGCGWGLMCLSLFLIGPALAAQGSALPVVLSALVSLALFQLLEYRHWLSRLMGLRVTPDSPAWRSALFLWLFGIPGLLVRSTLAAREEAPQAAKTPAKTTSDAPPTDGFREIVETIVFVVVLVLLLKSFAAEAFVIPTGSMAETLLGYQKMVVCPKCGFEFPVNCSQQIDPQSGPPDPIIGGACPNCRERIRFAAPDDPPALTGDRVLVAKFIYDLFETPPNRLDVVVFKYPGDESFPRTGPFRDGVPMNYIKRLVGLPGETIAIHNGNLYVLPAPDAKRIEDVRKKLHDELGRDPTPDEMHDRLLKQYGQLAYFDLEREPDPIKRAELAKELWQKDHVHGNDRDAEQLFQDGSFQIIRKAPDTVLSMRRIVYDNDHPAKDLIGVQPPRWADRDITAAWKADEAHHSFQLAPPSDDKVHWLGYHHLLRDMGDKPELITDFMGYNTWEGQRLGHQSPGENWVGDLSLDCDVDVPQAQGELTLELSKGVDRFEARFNLADGDCKLVRIEGDQETVLDHKLTGLKSGTHSVRFADVDERLTVWVDDALPFGDGVTYTPPENQGPTKENDLERPAGIGVQGTAATVRGVKLWRDSYYTVGVGGNPGRSDAGYGVRYDDPTTWGELAHLPVKTMYVQPNPIHYLCLGDNSPESSDGRSWGLVPDRLLLGKAVAIYYPFNRFGRIR